MIDINLLTKFEVKNIKTGTDVRGYVWTDCTLYLNNVKLGQFSDDGCSCGEKIQFENKDCKEQLEEYLANHPEIAEAIKADYAKTVASWRSDIDSDTSHLGFSYFCESIVNALVTQKEIDKVISKNKNKGIVFLKEGDDPSEVSTIKWRGFTVSKLLSREDGIEIVQNTVSKLLKENATIFNKAHIESFGVITF